MNPIEMLRTLVEGLAEGERVKKFGYGYREKARGQELENERSALELADLPQAQKEKHGISQIALAAEAERKAQDEADLLAHPGAGTVAAMKAKRDEEARDLKKSQTNAQIALEQAQTESAKRNDPNFRPDISPESANYLGVSQSSDAGPMPLPTNTDIGILGKKREEEARVRAAAAGRAASIGAPIAPDAVANVAARVAAGEMTFTEGRQALGGVRSGAGALLAQALGDSRVIPAPVRKDLQGIKTTRNIVDQMEELMNNIINATDPVERAKNTLLLEQFGQTTGTLLSRGFGERGVVTDRDVARATGLVPGWKATNFAPEYARREIALLREVLDRNEQGIAEGYFQTQSRTGGVSVPGASKAGTDVVRYDKNGQRIQ